jgi:hypothetical protein
LVSGKAHVPFHKIANIFLNNFPKMSYNVSAVFASPDKGFAQQRPWLVKCGWSEP